jgi:CBS domain-containing protein
MVRFSRHPDSGMGAALGVARMLAADLMSVFPATVDAQAPARYALATALLHGVHHLVVMNGREIVAVVCRCELQAARPREPAMRCTRSRPVAILSSQPLAEAAHAMLATGVGCLAVVGADGALRGTLTRRDLCQAGFLAEAGGCTECGADRSRSTSCPDKPGVCPRCAARAIATSSTPLVARALP